MTDNGFTAEQIQERLDNDNLTDSFSGRGYPNEAERNNFPAVRLGANILATAERRAGWTYDDSIYPVEWSWSTRDGGKSAKFTVEITDTKDYSVDLFLSMLYSDKNPIAVTEVWTHYSTLMIKASVWEKHVEEYREKNPDSDL